MLMKHEILKDEDCSVICGNEHIERIREDENNEVIMDDILKYTMKIIPVKGQERSQMTINARLGSISPFVNIYNDIDAKSE